MGITQKTIERLNPYLQSGKSILVLGCQNLYFNPYYGAIAHKYFEDLGLTIKTIDILGCQGAEIVDLRYPVDLGKYDIVLDAGTSEHCDGGYYEVCKNIHNACKAGGVIIRENPKTGNWVGHGCNYLNMEFYHLLASMNGYNILDLCEEAAMGNVTDGWNISAVLQKVNDNPFITEEQFNEIGNVFIS